MTATVAERHIASMMNESQPDETQPVRRLTLAAVPSAVTIARLLVQHSLADWNVDGRVLVAVEEAAAALVSHAVETTGVSDHQPIYDDVFDDLGLIKVRVRLVSDQVVIEVWDDGTEPPLDDLARSRAITTSSDWGFDHSAPDRRVVWAAFLMAAQESEAETAVLPRVRGPTPRIPEKQPAAVMRDPEVLQAVLDELRRLGGEAETKGQASGTSSEGGDRYG